MAKVPTKDAYIKPAVFIDRKVTAYNTRFKASALMDVMHKINTDGLPVLMNHDSSKFPVGMWYKAKVNEREQLVSEFYVPKEIPEHDDLTARIETGILDSVSIGFSAREHDCSICGNDIYDYENCSHIPGKMYNNEICCVELGGINASEGSLVYSGAVRDAKLQDSYSLKSDLTKEDFVKNYSNAYSNGQLEIVQTGNIIQNHSDNFNKGPEMTIEELQSKYSAQTESLAVVTSKYSDLLEKHSAIAADVLKLDEYKNQVEVANTSKAEVDQKFATLLGNFKAQVEKLALPFEADYKAPENFDDLVAAFETYMEKTKALPVGKQSDNPDADEPKAYSIPDDCYKI